MPSDRDNPDWLRLGELLERGRVELDRRYANLALFCRERGIDYRLAWDLEHGARTNYRRPTLVAAELAYGWQRGSVGRVLAGGEPVPAGLAPAERAIHNQAPTAYGKLLRDQDRTGS